MSFMNTAPKDTKISCYIDFNNSLNRPTLIEAFGGERFIPDLQGMWLVVQWVEGNGWALNRDGTFVFHPAEWKKIDNA